ncbi:ArnT family glycosyltransferase [Patescibacteria group bacterium]
MQWAKTINKQRILIILGFVGLFLVTRIPQLGLEAINPDAVNWHYRSEQFVVGLKHQLWDKTYQHYHPGVTLMWLTGIPVEIFKQITDVTVYNQFSFYAFHFIAKYSLVITQLVLSLLILFWFSKTIKFKKAFLLILLLSFEPFTVGNSRMFHMDIIFALFVMASLVLSHLYIKEEKISWAILTGLFCGLSFLTRSIGVGVLLFVLGFGGLFLYIKTKDWKKILKYVLIVLGAGVVSTFVLFPALWSDPINVLVNIFTEGERIGIRNGHTQIIFGRSTETAGWLFYPMVLLLKLSPFIIFGVLSYLEDIYKIFKNNKVKKEIILFKDEKIVGIITYSIIFYLGYFMVMSWPTKKIDRYMLVVYPLIALLSAFGFANMIEYLKNKWKAGLVGLVTLFIIFVLYPVFKQHPYQFTYTSPLFGRASSANDIIGQKSFGIGIFEVKEHLQTNYGSNVEVGFIDTKPIKSIYPNSLVSDIRINGVSDYDVLVLAINEVMPEKVANSDTKFIQDSSIFINGLEYWRFYVKKDK